MPGAIRIFWKISVHNGKIFFLKNMLFTLSLKPLCSHLIFGKQNNTRGLLIEPSDWADTDGGLFILKIGGNLIGKCICIMCTGWMREHSGWFIYGKNILIFIQDIHGRKIIRNKLCGICFGSFQTNTNLVTGKNRFCNPAAHTILQNTVRKKFCTADLLFGEAALRTENLSDGSSI